MHMLQASPDGKLFATASADKTVRIWDMASGECLQTLVGHTSHVPTLAWTPDGTKLISGGWGLGLLQQQPVCLYSMRGVTLGNGAGQMGMALKMC